MNRFLSLILRAWIFPVLCSNLLFGADHSKLPPLPAPVSGNAVASGKNAQDLYSLMGIGGKKTWDDISNRVFTLHLGAAGWREVRPVPGVAGRLGAVAVGVKNKIYLFGGYVVDSAGSEIIVPDVNVYLADEGRWYRAADIPTPVDSAVAVVSQNRYIYLIGGRSKNGPVNTVQLYDAEKNTWADAAPAPEGAVYGHAGGIADDTIVFVDGAKKNPGRGVPYVASDECWLGKIDRKDPAKIGWTQLPAHPGPGRFGIESGTQEHRVIFSGGTTSPHNFKGAAYDGKPLQASSFTFAYDVHANHWETLSEDTPDPRSDASAILETQYGAVILGGLKENGAPTAEVFLLPKK
jgi:N-acetylneuraminic acid mutarotase